MKKHIIGDSYIIHKIQPMPEGFHSRDTPLVGNKYQNEELWNVYKDREDAYVTNVYHATQTSGTSPIKKETRLWFDGWKLIGLDTHFMSSSELTYKGTGAYYNMGFITKSGHLIFVLNGNQNKAPYGYSMRFYKTKQPVVTPTTDYQYFYDTLGENLSVDDFEWWDLDMYSKLQSASYQTPRIKYMKRSGKVMLASSGAAHESLRGYKWYADDRNGTNEEWKRTVLYWVYNPETNSIENTYTLGDLLAPKSLTKFPSSDPWNAIGNYAFDINNVEELLPGWVNDGSSSVSPLSIDLFSDEFYFQCDIKVKEFYTTGFPETPAFNYKNMSYIISPESKSPIVISYANGGSVTSIRGFPSRYGSAVFNNRFINSADALSGLFSNEKGVEVLQPDINFKTTDEMSKVHTAYNFGKRFESLNASYFNGGMYFGTSQTWGDNDSYSTSNRYNSLKDPNLPIAIPMEYRKYDTYLEERCFVLDGAGFRFVGDNSFLEQVRVLYPDIDNGGRYRFMAHGWEYTIGGEILQSLYLRFLEQGGTPEMIRSDLYSPSVLIHGIDSKGYYIASPNSSSYGGNFLRDIKTSYFGASNAGDVGSSYRISPDMTEIIQYQHNGSYNKSVFMCASQDRYITRNWEKKGSSGILFGMRAGIFYPDMQLDTFKLPIINIENGSDYVYITKIKETETEPDMKDKK